MARLADEAGYDAVWVGDSVVAKPRLEPLTTLAYLGGITRRVRLGTAVLLPALRHPVVLAHEIANVDQISRGRVVLGLGVGWSLPSAEREWAACGADHKRRGPPPRGACRALASALARRAADIPGLGHDPARSHHRAASLDRGRTARADNRGQSRRDARRPVRPVRPAWRRYHHHLRPRRGVPARARAGRGSAGPPWPRPPGLPPLRLHDGAAGGIRAPPSASPPTSSPTTTAVASTSGAPWESARRCRHRRAPPLRRGRGQRSLYPLHRATTSSPSSSASPSRSSSTKRHQLGPG